MTQAATAIGIVVLMAWPATAANAVVSPPTTDPPGAVSTNAPVTVTGTTGEQALPANLSAVATSVSAPTGRVAANSNGDGFTYTGISANGSSNCPWPGANRTTADMSTAPVPVTVTFPKPVVDPYLMFNLGGVNYSGPGFFLGLRPSMTFTSVNGSPLTDGSITRTTDDGESFDGATYRLVTPEAYPAPSAVALVNFQAHGLVSSITYNLTYTCQYSSSTTATVGHTVSTSAVQSRVRVGVPATDLAVSSSTAPTTEQGGTASFTTEVTNNGPAASSGFALTGTVPAELTDPQFVGDAPGCTIAGATFTCVEAPSGGTVTPRDDGTFVSDLAGTPATVLAAGGKFGVTIAGAVPADATGELTASASVSGIDADTAIETNNTATSTTTVVSAPVTTPPPGDGTSDGSGPGAGSGAGDGSGSGGDGASGTGPGGDTGSSAGTGSGGTASTGPTDTVTPRNTVERADNQASHASELAFTGNDPWPMISVALVLLSLGVAAAVAGAKLRTRP
ncbi:hypothetical protein AAEP80_00470 [Curtobacterium sp. L3-7]|uniref:hypothetical protein n=1 Tax=Curtobacterium sp. L3-7 TaxID=3138787 RepID=UPI003B5232C7